MAQSEPKIIFGRIYKIIGSDPEGKCYVGSTTKSLKQRFNKHKRQYRYYNSQKLESDPKKRSRIRISSYELFDIDGPNACQIILLESCINATCKLDLRIREQYYIEQLNCVNIVSAVARARIGIKLFDCPLCGCTVNADKRTRHYQTKKHLKNMEK